MNSYVVCYNSPRNLFSGKMAIDAESLAEAADKFLNWLRIQDVYQHLWSLEFEFYKVDNLENGNV